MKRKHIFLILAIITTAFIFRNSAMPAVESSQSSGRIVKFLLGILAYFKVSAGYGVLETIVRKSAHIAEFFAQAFFIAGSFSGKYKKRIVYVLFFGLLTACTDEWIQLFSDGRAGRITDIFIDFGGTAAATLLGSVVFRRR